MRMLLIKLALNHHNSNKDLILWESFSRHDLFLGVCVNVCINVSLHNCYYDFVSFSAMRDRTIECKSGKRDRYRYSYFSQWSVCSLNSFRNLIAMQPLTKIHKTHMKMNRDQSLNELSIKMFLSASNFEYLRAHCAR